MFQCKYEAEGQELPEMKNYCENHISIKGSSNVNQFQLINHNPKIVRLSDRGDDGKRDQRIEISVNQFRGANKRIREDFLEMVNASEYPFIIMTIESRNLAECRKRKGLSDFETEITIAGVSQRFVVPCAVDTCESSGYVLKGSLEVKLTDFGIDPPKKFFGLVKVDNEVLIAYVFRFQTDDDIFRLPVEKQTGFNTINDGFIAGGWQEHFFVIARNESKNSDEILRFYRHLCLPLPQSVSRGYRIDAQLRRRGYHKNCKGLVP